MSSLRFSTLVLAAGKGTRMKSDLPKVLHRACGRSLLSHVLHATDKAGAQKHHIVVGHGKDLVAQELKNSGFAFSEAWQKDQKGTGHAAQVALGNLKKEDELLLIVNGDGPLLKSENLIAMLESHISRKADLTLGVMELDQPFGYGRVISSKGVLKSIVEEKEANAKEKAVRVVNGGVYLVSRKYLEDFLPRLKASAKTGEIYLTDIVALGAAKKKRLQTFLFSPEEMMGVNDLKQLAEVESVLRQRLYEGWMREGVRIADPKALWADCTVSVAAGAYLGPAVVLEGKSRIEAGARVEVGCVIKDSVVGAGAELKAYSHLEGAVVGEGAHVGPFARLRPNANLGRGAKVGNFVEVKNSSLGEGAKVNHLSYVGDADVGRDVNIGCGFIACNYDGVNKHKTTIEDGVFVGSGVQAVAPITIGRDSYVATGSTINRDVPAGSLAIARVKQENKEGYAARLKSRMQAKKKGN